MWGPRRAWGGAVRSADMTAGHRSGPPTAADAGDGWEVVDAGALADELRDELWREAAPTHLLHRSPARAMARCTQCGMAAFHLGQGTFAVVELTWSGHEEEAPLPALTQLPTFDALRETMARHRHW